MGHAHQFRLGAQVHSCGKCIAWARAASEGLGAGKDGQGCIANKVPQTRWRRAPLHTKALDSQGSWPQAQTQDQPFKKHLCTLALLEFWVG